MGPGLRTGAFWLSLYAAVCLLALAICWLFASNVVLTDAHTVAGMLRAEAFWSSVRLSVVTSTVTTAIAFALGVPAAYALSRLSLRGADTIDALLTLPLVLPASTIGLALLVAFQYEPVLQLQEKLGFRLAYSQPGIVVAQLVLALTLGIKAWKAAFDSISVRYEHVARSLGSSAAHAFRRVTLPLARPGLVAGAVLAWTHAIAEFGAVLIFCSAMRGKTDILPVSMFLDVNAGYNERAIATGLMLALLALAPVYALGKLGLRRAR